VKHFVDHSQLPQQWANIVNYTPGYVEMETHVIDPQPLVYYWYVFRWDDHSLLIAAYPSKDQMLTKWSQIWQHPEFGRIGYDQFKETWPLTLSLFQHSWDSLYSAGVITTIEDPDDGDQKWVVGTLVGNIDLGSGKKIERVLHSDRVLEAGRLVTTLAAQITNELETKQISRKSEAKADFRALMGGVKDGTKISVSWIPKLMGLSGPFRRDQ
jgi:hypothetical protein